MTDTIGWGDDDARPRRLPRLRLNRRRRIALVVVAALVAGGIVAWPSFRSWRAEAAARHVQRIWARMEGFDNTRIQSLAAVQRTISSLDGPEFQRAVISIEKEEATDLDRLARQARELRTWTADVAKARKAVLAAIVAQAKALRAQASGLFAIGIDLPVTTAIDDDASNAIDAAGVTVEEMRAHRHLLLVGPTTEHFRATATGAYAALLRPTDQLLRLRLVTSGATGTVVTDLDTGKVLLNRALDTTDSINWQPLRIMSQTLIGADDNGTTFVPLTAGGAVHVVPNTSLQSSTGSPVWLQPLAGRTVQAFDVSGRAMGRPVPVPANLDLTGMGNGSVLLASHTSDQSSAIPFTDGPGPTTTYYLFHPGTGRVTRLGTAPCNQSPSFGGVVAVPTGPDCAYATELHVYDLNARLVRTITFPHGDVMASQPVCSPDGAHVGVFTSRRPPLDNPDVPTVLRILDLKTGAWTTVTTPPNWALLKWSSDSRTLLLAETTDINGSASGQQFGQLGYVQIGDTMLHSIRVTADLGDFLS